MKKPLIFLLIFFLFFFSLQAKTVTIIANREPAAKVFRNIMEQTGMNFVYSSEILKDLKVTVKANNMPLKKVLEDIFKDTDISYRIKGKNVILKKEKRKKQKEIKTKPKPLSKVVIPDSVIPTFLKEVVIFPETQNSNVEIPVMGFSTFTNQEIKNTPTLFGESDIIRTLHTQPGVTEGIEGIAGMYVDGGNPDENLYLLDNIPIYNSNHFAGLFSAFNTDIIHTADFYKTGIPAKFDGRLSSYTDVKLMKGKTSGHHGSARIGLTSGAFNISGPIGRKTTYLVGVRRSWYDVLTIPTLAIINSTKKDSKSTFHYYFTDLNAKIYHDFSNNLSGFVNFYYGNDHLVVGHKEEIKYFEKIRFDKNKANFVWGNFVAQTGLSYNISPFITSEFTIAYNNYFSRINLFSNEWNQVDNNLIENKNEIKGQNNIRDLLVKGDFQWIPLNNIRTEFGVNYVFHSFLPNRFIKRYEFQETTTVFRDSTKYIPGNEANAYIDFNWKISDKIRFDLGIHGSIFNFQGKTYTGLSPRGSFNYKPSEEFALKAAYSHTIQYIHQLTRSYLALPTDQWIPITGNFKPETADKLAVGAYWKTRNGNYEVSVEAYYKKMKNLIDYKDEYYLYPALEMWSGQLTSGSGTSKGIDIKFEKKVGKFTGHISYSLAWADRLFKEKNGGRKFPSRFDNRHTINILVNWEINPKVTLNAAWVGHSGNRYTLLEQSFETPDDSSSSLWDWGIPMKAELNSYQLPFYHRLDLAFTVKNKHGYWNFSLYNAYCHLNTIAIVRESEDNRDAYNNEEGYFSTIPVFKKLKLFPAIPSISYTWEF